MLEADCLDCTEFWAIYLSLLDSYMHTDLVADICKEYKIGHGGVECALVWKAFHLFFKVDCMTNNMVNCVIMVYSIIVHVALQSGGIII